MSWGGEGGRVAGVAGDGARAFRPARRKGGSVRAVGRADVGADQAAGQVDSGAGSVQGPRQIRAGADASSRVRAWAELLRLPALFTVPGDALAGAAAAGVRPNHRTMLAIGSSLCLYEAGMALNDWADHDEDALERPHRPLPSGRIHPTAAFAAACAFTAGGLALAARAGRPALAVAAPLAATVWAYDLAVKHTPAGPPTMALARGLDLLLGAAATAGRTREAVPSAAVLGTHTLAVTTVSRQETRGGSPLVPLAALATTAVLTRLLTRPSAGRDSAEPSAKSPARSDRIPLRPLARSERAGLRPSVRSDRTGFRPLARSDRATFRPPARSDRTPFQPSPDRADAPTIGLPVTPTTATPNPLPTALTTAYVATIARPYFHAALNPSPPLTQRAVAGGIRAMIPLQATLAARSGAPVTALLTAALAPIARRFARKVTIT